MNLTKIYFISYSLIKYKYILKKYIFFFNGSQSIKLRKKYSKSIKLRKKYFTFNVSKKNPI